MQKKAVCCVVCPIFNTFLEKEKKKEEARLSLYPIFPLSYSVLPLFGLSLATTTLLHSLFSLHLSLSFSLVYRSKVREKYIYVYIPNIAKYNKDPSIIPLFTLPNRP